jgi:hypothetical protein
MCSYSPSGYVQLFTIGYVQLFREWFGVIVLDFHEKADLCQCIRSVQELFTIVYPCSMRATIKPSDEKTDPRVGKNRWMRQS